MTFLPELTIGLNTLMWVSFLFWITNLVVLKVYPSHYKKRVLKMPRFNGSMQRIMGTFNFSIFQGLLILTLFLPVVYNQPYFILGLSIFLLSYLSYMMSIINYAQSNPEKPVVKGIYRISRNPQQLCTIIMFIGVGFMSASGIVLLICLIQLFTVYPTFVAQEKFCIEKYGKDYEAYMKKTCRYLGTK